MKKTVRAIASLIIASILASPISCKKDDDSDDITALALLAALMPRAAQTPPPPESTCVEFPETITDNQGTWSCSVSGLVRTCTSGTNTKSFTYPDIAAAGRDLVIAPATTDSRLLTLFRGSSIQSNNTTFSFTVNAQNQATQVSSPFPYNTSLSNHDENGFPQTCSGDCSGTITLTYGEGGTKPTRASFSASTLIGDFSSGVMTSYDSGGGPQAVTSSGTIQMCE